MQRIERGTLRRLVGGLLFFAFLGTLHYMAVHNKPFSETYGCFWSHLEEAQSGYTKQGLQEMGYAPIETEGRLFLEICIF